MKMPNRAIGIMIAASVMAFPGLAVSAVESIEDVIGDYSDLAVIKFYNGSCINEGGDDTVDHLLDVSSEHLLGCFVEGSTNAKLIPGALEKIRTFHNKRKTALTAAAIAYLLIYSGQFEEASKFLDEQGKRFEKDSRISLYSAVALWNLGKNELAESQFDSALANASNLCETLKVYGSFLVSQDKGAQKLVSLAGHYKEFCAQDSDYLQIIAFARSLVDDVGGAIKGMEAALALKPDCERCVAFLGAMNLHTGNNSESIRHFKKASKIRPDAGFYYFYLAQAYARQGDNQSAKKYLEEAKQRGASIGVKQ